MRKVDVIIPTQHKHDVPKLLKEFQLYAPFYMVFHVIDDGHNWPTATNIGLKKANRDVILCDDDIELLPDTFKDFDDYYDKADMFGFKLLYPNRTIQHAGGFFVGHYGQHSQEDKFCTSRYCDHITTSLCYIKKHVFEKIGYMAEDYPGEQFEDVDFTIRMKNAGFKKLYIPNKAIHHESATKKQTVKDFNKKMNLNYDELVRRHNL